MKVHIPQVFVLDVGLDHDFRVYFLDGVITINCPVCPTQKCIRAGHSYKGLDIICLKDIPRHPGPIMTRVIPKNIWFQEVCKEVISMLQHLWDAWELELFQGNKNVFLVRKDLGDGTYETGFMGREGRATDPPDLSFKEPTWIPEFRYSRLPAF